MQVYIYTPVVADGPNAVATSRISVAGEHVYCKTEQGLHWISYLRALERAQHSLPLVSNT